MTDAEPKRLTCMTCCMFFPSHEEQVTHYKHDLHRFNLKRKMVHLPPVAMDVFESKMETLKPTDKQNEDLNCKSCRKRFSSANAYRQHLESKKHKENVDRDEEREAASPTVQKRQTKDVVTIEPDIPEDETEEQQEARFQRELEERIKNAPKLTPEDCLFCSEQRDFEDNMAHMAKQHGFFIPDIEYMVDIKGLIKYLGEKITIGHSCLYCNRFFSTYTAARDHMRDVGHCKLAYDGEDMLEYDDFYDFGEDNDIPDVDANIVDTTDYELTLANGKVLGNRNLARYYKQNYNAPETREMVLVNQNVSKQYKALGWHEQGTVASRAAKRADIKRTIKQDKHNMTLGVRNNWLWRFRNSNITFRNSGR